MYDDAHRCFVQFMLKNKYVSNDVALQFAKEIEASLGVLKNLKNFVQEINSEISKQELKIAFAKCEVTGDAKLLLLNTANDDVAKLQNVFTPVELEYFQALFKELVVIPDHKISSMACFNLSTSLNNTIRKDNVETLLNKWKKEGYLVIKDSFTYLGPRCIVEFAPYFSQHCKQYITLCYLCSDLVFLGKSCSNCKKGMHRYCIDKYLEKQSRCPSCKETWTEGQSDCSALESSNEVGTDSEVGMASEIEATTPRAGPSTRKKRRVA